MVEGIGDDGILFGQQGFEETSVGIKTSRIEDGIFGAEEIRDNALQLFVRILRAADEAHRRHAVTARIHAGFGSLDEFFVIGEAEVVVRTEIDHFLSAFYGNAGRLRGDDDPLVLIEACIANLIQRFLQVLLKILIHSCFVFSRALGY